jgi:hypothetical protein
MAGVAEEGVPPQPALGLELIEDGGGVGLAAAAEQERGEEGQQEQQQQLDDSGGASPGTRARSSSMHADRRLGDPSMRPQTSITLEGIGGASAVDGPDGARSSGSGWLQLRRPEAPTTEELEVVRAIEAKARAQRSCTRSGFPWIDKNGERQREVKWANFYAAESKRPAAGGGVAAAGSSTGHGAAAEQPQEEEKEEEEEEEEEEQEFGLRALAPPSSSMDGAYADAESRKAAFDREAQATQAANLCAAATALLAPSVADWIAPRPPPFFPGESEPPLLGGEVAAALADSGSCLTIVPGARCSEPGWRSSSRRSSSSSRGSSPTSRAFCSRPRPPRPPRPLPPPPPRGAAAHGQTGRSRRPSRSRSRRQRRWTQTYRCVAACRGGPCRAV